MFEATLPAFFPLFAPAARTNSGRLQSLHVFAGNDRGELPTIPLGRLGGSGLGPFTPVTCCP